MEVRHDTAQPHASANAGWASRLHSDVTGPAWLRWSFARRGLGGTVQMGFRLEAIQRALGPPATLLQHVRVDHTEKYVRSVRIE